MYRATRYTSTDPFGSVQRIGANTGHVEAPTLSRDERLLYYHHEVSPRGRRRQISYLLGAPIAPWEPEQDHYSYSHLLFTSPFR